MKTQVIFLAIVVSIFLSSCAVVNKTNTTKTMDIYGAGVIQKPIIVDLDVKGTKVTGTASGVYSSEVEPLKHLAVSDVLKTANADVLVEPKFEIESSSGRLNVTVTGWPATYTNFRPITKDDVELLNVGVIQKAEVFEATKVTKANKESDNNNSASIVLGVLMGVFLGFIAVSLF